MNETKLLVHFTKETESHHLPAAVLEYVRTDIFALEWHVALLQEKIMINVTQSKLSHITHIEASSLRAFTVTEIL